ncbi:MAG: flagellar hook capping FlgD N-terminal domain-containing protein [Bacillota bacterium]
MAISSITNTTSSTTSTQRTSNSELGKDDFMNLLITELKYQDPLDPMEGTEYVTQLAQFSTLEQMYNLNTSLSSMEALSMTGKYITATVTDSTGTTSLIEGTVDSVKMKNGKATLVVNGTDVEMENVTNVYDYDRSDISSLTSMIGKTGKGYIYDSDSLDVINVEGTISGVEKGKYEDYALMDGVKLTLQSITSDDYKSSQSKMSYLNDNIGNEISIEVKDSSTGKVVSVTAVLDGATEESDGSITVTMSNVRVPEDGIYSVK